MRERQRFSNFVVLKYYAARGTDTEKVDWLSNLPEKHKYAFLVSKRGYLHQSF